MRIFLILVLNIRAKSHKGLKVVRSGRAHVEKERTGQSPKHHRRTPSDFSRRRGMLPPARMPDSGTSKALDASGVALKRKGRFDAMEERAY